MSGYHELSSHEERDFEDDDESAENQRLFHALDCNDAAAVQRALQDGANVNAVRYDSTPLMIACERGFEHIVGILLDAGADARCEDDAGKSAIAIACGCRHLSTVQLLINHDNGLLDMTNNIGWTPLFRAILGQHSDFVRFLLYSGADPHHVGNDGETSLMIACKRDSLEIVRLLLATGVDVEARGERQQTALPYAARWGMSEVVRELILQHNANMFAVNRDGHTPFDLACASWRNNATVNALLELYGNKLTQDHGRLALHELLKAAEYSFAREVLFHPPQNPLRIVLLMGKLTLKHLRTLLHTLDPELIRNRDDTGKLPIHIACQTSAPVEVLALILELDPAVLHIADSTGALPIHLLCGSTTTAAAEYATVRYLVEQGGVGTLAARDQQGLLPLHVLCGSTNPPLRAVQYLMRSFPVSLVMQTNAGHYPFIMAAAAEVDATSASLSVVYELVRANPGLVVPR